jgi:hypothetical protein
MYSFGSGVLLGTRTDNTPGANITPVNFGLVQEVTIEETATIKELTGQFQRPVAIARGTIKTHGKAKVARISGMVFANLFYGVAPSAGQLATSFGEAGTVPATAPFTVPVANAATFTDDEGVLYAATGLPLTKVTSAPAAGQYSVAVGVYTFNSADAGKAVLISYTYTVAAAGQKFTVANQDANLPGGLLHDLSRPGHRVEVEQLHIEQIELPHQARGFRYAGIRFLLLR